ncbi:hypothetical protein J1614_000401 [Plenodomus biglobosus]|nr:hypothetical protein J1614_000401 [Plenodomus biglobosus]
MPSSSRIQRSTLGASLREVHHPKDYPQNGNKAIASTTTRHTLLNLSARRALRQQAKAQLINVYLSTAPVQIVCHKVPWSALVQSCSTENIAPYIAQHPEKTKCLVLPAADCDPKGVRTVIS